MASGWEACVKGIFLGHGQMIINFLSDQEYYPNLGISEYNNVTLQVSFRCDSLALCICVSVSSLSISPNLDISEYNKVTLQMAFRCDPLALCNCVSVSSLSISPSSVSIFLCLSVCPSYPLSHTIARAHTHTHTHTQTYIHTHIHMHVTHLCVCVCERTRARFARSIAGRHAI